jgi:RNA polymerase sigma factor for flagellar operon FliA
MAYWPMLTRVVGRIRQTLPPHVRVEEDDLRSYGLMGLYKALDAYEPERGHAFDKFASNHVRGKVLDELRKMDWAPRSLRKRQKDLEKAKIALRESLRREPTDDELAEELRWTTDDINQTRKQIDTAWPRSLDEIRGEADRDLYSIIADTQGNPESYSLGSHDSHENDRSTILTDQMASFLDSMPPQKKAVAIFCYYLDMKQSEVASVLGIPESRVSNLHLSIMEDIHAQLERLLRT